MSSSGSPAALFLMDSSSREDAGQPRTHQPECELRLTFYLVVAFLDDFLLLWALIARPRLSPLFHVSRLRAGAERMWDNI